MRKMNILSKFFIYRKLDSLSKQEFKLQTEYKELLEELNQKFGCDKNLPPDEIKEVFKQKRVEGKNVYHEWARLDVIMDGLAKVAEKKKKILAEIL